MSLPNPVRSFKFLVRRKTTRYSSSLSLRAEGLLPSTDSKMKHGFTLIELLVVIAIIGILLATATVSFTAAQKKARDNRRKSDLKSLQQTLELYFQTAKRYPGTFIGQIKCTNPPYTNEVKLWGSKFNCWIGPIGTGTEVVFMNILPQDPVYQTTTGYFYVSGTPTTYQISAKLENTNDPEYCVSTGTNCVDDGKLPCEPSTNKNYCVINP